MGSEHQLTSVSIPPLLTSKETFCACVVGKVSWLREWGICGFLSSIWAGPSLLSQLSCYSWPRVSVHKEQTQTICPGGPSISCLSITLNCKKKKKKDLIIINMHTLIAKYWVDTTNSLRNSEWHVYGYIYCGRHVDCIHLSKVINLHT